jgi:general secretion pathway protein G
MGMGDTPGRCDGPIAHQSRCAQDGFTLLEMMMISGVIAILAAIALPLYLSSVQRAKVARASSDISQIANVIARYVSEKEIPPPDLNAVAFDTLLDPWGRPYVYQSFTGLQGKGKMRKDKNLNPLNTQYDLYSMGADGQSKLPLTAPVSKDDVILAFDGNYIGIASDF